MCFAKATKVSPKWLYNVCYLELFHHRLVCFVLELLHLFSHHLGLMWLWGCNHGQNLRCIAFLAVWHSRYFAFFWRLHCLLHHIIPNVSWLVNHLIWFQILKLISVLHLAWLYWGLILSSNMNCILKKKIRFLFRMWFFFHNFYSEFFLEFFFKIVFIDFFFHNLYSKFFLEFLFKFFFSYFFPFFSEFFRIFFSNLT